MSGKRRCKYDQEEMELRRGPWTLEEDTLLIHYIACHGEGRWNMLANCSGLKRTGKSCRLRWLNYLKPDVKRGNLTPEEQILILELHSKWGNRWSRIAQHLPGRTDNEIKNYWRTRVQKQARQLKIDANSALFCEAVRCFWMPRLIEKMGSSQIHHNSPSLQDAAPILLSHQQSFPHHHHQQQQQQQRTGLLTTTGFDCYVDLTQLDSSCSPQFAATVPHGEFLLNTICKNSSNSCNNNDSPLLQGNGGGGGGNQLVHTTAANSLGSKSTPGAIASASASDCYSASLLETNCMVNVDDSLWNSMVELWQPRKLHTDQWEGI